MKWISFLLFFSSFCHAEPRDLKILLLIIASDNLPIYEEFQKCWRTYMHSDPEHIEAYFLKGNPRLNEAVKIEGDTIWCKTAEGLSPASAGIINKTMMAMEGLLPRIKTEFDYVIRSNLSTFYAFHRLFTYLNALPRTRCYAGSNTGGDSIIASGTGIILSPDVVELLVANKARLLGFRNDPDDCLIGFLLKKHDIHLRRHERLDIHSLAEWNQWKSQILTSDLFHFRVKRDENNNYNRIPNDLIVYSELHDIFYPIGGR